MRSVLGAVLLLLLAMAALPERVLAEMEVYGFVADYNWREYGGNSLTAKERGPVYGVGIAGSYRAPAPTLLSLGWKAEGFGAGHTFHTYGSNSTHSGDGDFNGFTLEGNAGMPLQLQKGPLIEPFVGLGGRYWGRSFPTIASEGSAPYTQHEGWWNFYGKTGLRVTHRPLESPMVLFAEGGARISLIVRNNVDLSKIGYGEANLSPGNRVSGFAEAGIKYNIFKLSLFYEGLRFAGSQVGYAPLTSTSAAAASLPSKMATKQFQTAADIFGLKLGVTF